MLSKELTLYQRDENGDLIPQTVKLETIEEEVNNHPELKDETIKVTPMTRGELRKMFNLTGNQNEKQPDTDKDEDGQIILKHCHEPKFNEEDLPYIKPMYVRAIVRTIFRESGVQVDDTSGARRVNEEMDEFGKK